MTALVRLDPTDVGRRVVVRRLLPDGRASDVLGELLRMDSGGLSVRADTGSSAGRVVDVAAADVVAARPVPPPPPRRSRLPREHEAEPEAEPGPEPAPGILALERTAAAGWPAPVTDRLGGWLLRAAGGWTRRANSALALGSPGVALPDALEAVEAFAGRHEVRPRVALPRTASGAALDGDLEALLAGRGWIAEGHTAVLTADLTALAHVLPDDVPVSMWRDPSPAWLAAYRHGGQPLPALGRSVMTGPAVRAFAAVERDGTVVALARASTADGWLGITDVQVDPAHRRHGLARALLAALGGWGARQGAQRAYLQVEEDNAPALALYAAVGMSVHHRSVYRTAP